MEIKEIQNERELDYGNAKEAHQAIADSWSVYLSRKFRMKIELEAKDVAILMVLFKSMREAYKHKYDNLLDLASYADFAKSFCEGETKVFNDILTPKAIAKSKSCEDCWYNDVPGSSYPCYECVNCSHFKPNCVPNEVPYSDPPVEVNAEDSDDRYCKSCWEFKDVCTCGKQ